MGVEVVRVFIASCGHRGGSVYERYLRELARLARGRETIFTESASEADIILIVDIHDSDWYLNLRRNRTWMRYPAKAFGLDENDNPPPMLHGIYSSLPKSWRQAGRFQSCGYYVHQQRFANSCPSPEEVWQTPKDWLFSFCGRNSHKIREAIFLQSFPGAEVFLEDTTTYNHFQLNLPRETSRQYQERYWNAAMRSKFALCPRGNGPSSIRLFEMLQAGIAPVIISDEWTPPLGPAWEEFALVVPEAEVRNLYQIIKSHEAEYRERGRLARRAFEQFFAPHRYWDGLLHGIEHIRQQQKVPEAYYAWTNWLWVLRQKLKRQRIKWGTRIKARFA